MKSLGTLCIELKKSLLRKCKYECVKLLNEDQKCRTALHRSGKKKIQNT